MSHREIWGAEETQVGLQGSPISAPQPGHPQGCSPGMSQQPPLGHLGTPHKEKIPVQSPGDPRGGSCTRKDVRKVPQGRQGCLPCK